MKRLILLVTTFVISLLLFSTQMTAQTAGKLYYVEVYENSTVAGKSVNVNFGKDAPFGMVFKITDETEQKYYDFKNAIAALNYLSGQGWRLVSVYEREIAKGTRKTFYLMEFDSSKHQKTALVKSIEKAVNECIEKEKSFTE